jgi:hypothetical protein
MSGASLLDWRRESRKEAGRESWKHGGRAGVLLLAWVAVGLLSATPADSFEALDGRLQAHGFFESQLRLLNSNYSDQWDVSQWYQVFNLELEMDILQDPIGILDTVSGYARLEVRYDCVYSRGCGMFRSINAYGDRSKSLPDRLNNAHDLTYIGAVPLERTLDPKFRPTRSTENLPYSQQTFKEKLRDLDLTPFKDVENGERRSGDTTDPVDLTRVSGFTTLAGGAGPDGFQGAPSMAGAAPGTVAFEMLPLESGAKQCAYKFATNPAVPVDGSPGAQTFTLCETLAGGTKSLLDFTDDPFFDVFAQFAGYRFTQIDGRGGGGDGLPTDILGPWLPKNFVYPNAGLADRVNPFDVANSGSKASQSLRAARYNQVLIDQEDVDGDTVGGTLADAQLAIATIAGGGANPYRPIPVVDEKRPNQGDSTPRGLYYPSRPLQQLLDSGDLDSFEFNYRENERAWNRGASQQDEKELKEAYLDIDLFDGRLWLRLGKQNIVWGKTELFRTTDQFNPQDLALASLPSLEESRIALWAVRGVWSFYEIGPLEDVRLELAFNFDQYEPADLGACGEAYTPNLVCTGITIGAFAHSNFGFGLVGQDRPPDPWQDIEGIELGGRLEFRWDRFSFALVDFWGYNDFPTAVKISTFQRNVDPRSGRPRVMGATGRCVTGTKRDQKSNAETDCLLAGPTDRGDDPDAPNNALRYHHANQQLFAVICSTTIGFSSLDITACAQTVFGSTADALPGAPGLLGIGEFIGGVMAGSGFANSAFVSQADVSFQIRIPLATLSRDANDDANPNTNGNNKPCVDQNALAKNPGLGGPCGAAIVPGAFFLDQGLAGRLTPEQEALLGCGPFWGSHCDHTGVDLLNMEASAVIQSFVGTEGSGEKMRLTNLNTNEVTLIPWRTDLTSSSVMTINGVPYRVTDENGNPVWQPGTVSNLTGQTFADNRGGPICTFGDLGVSNPSSTRKLPGCRGPRDAGYDVNVDGDPTGVTTLLDPTASTFDNTVVRKMFNEGRFQASGTAGHPFTGEAFQNELAALSWNFQALLVTQSAEYSVPLRNLVAKFGLGARSKLVRRAYAADDASKGKTGLCSFLQPQFCATPQALFAVLGVTRNNVLAGGNDAYGRRDFVWHSGGEVVLRYDKRNVLGFSMDFAEDVTKTNWGIETTWIEGVALSDNNQYDGLRRTNEFNLTVAVDRPTFVNFLNANRTFFITTQWFFRYWDNYHKGVTSNGPFNVLGILAIQTGYFQDRLLPSVTFVYDVQSVSGAALPQLTYRYNESFSVTLGAAVFMGRTQLKDAPLNPTGVVANRQGKHAYQDGVQNGLAVVKERDEVFLRLRYTF